MSNPIQLNRAQEILIRQWAADDRLWTTQETVEMNLATFARAILSKWDHVEEFATTKADVSLIEHGVDCPKAQHVFDRTGYEHAADSDGPYFVDGVRYCGRCHYHF